MSFEKGRIDQQTSRTASPLNQSDADPVKDTQATKPYQAIVSQHPAQFNKLTGLEPRMRHSPIALPRHTEA